MVLCKLELKCIVCPRCLYLDVCLYLVFCFNRRCIIDFNNITHRIYFVIQTHSLCNRINRLLHNIKLKLKEKTESNTVR